MPRLSQLARACRILSLPLDFEPRAAIAHIFEQIELSEIIACLRTNPKESAQYMCAMYEKLPKPLQLVINVDYLIAAAHVKDPHEIAGIITESYSRVKGMEAQVIAARESPSVMKQVGAHAKKARGFSHAKMLLQTSGVVAIPRSQVQHNYVIGNKIDKSQTLNINLPQQHEVVGDVNEILAKLPANVSSEEDSRQNRSHRKG